MARGRAGGEYLAAIQGDLGASADWRSDSTCGLGVVGVAGEDAGEEQPVEVREQFLGGCSQLASGRCYCIRLHHEPKR